MTHRTLAWCYFLSLILPSLTSCAEISDGRTWHEKLGWKAEDYFSDPRVIALCKAIEANDIEEIDRLVDAGADVNAKGKGNMTPLLWAFPDNSPKRFKRLLELGADPNVIVESNFHTKAPGSPPGNVRNAAIVPGDAVTHLSCRATFPKYFDYVFQHGGDPNLWHRQNHETPLITVIRSSANDKKQRIARLIELGADLDANKDDEYTGGATPTMIAVSNYGQFDIALQLLKAGADYGVYMTNSNTKLIHIVAGAKRRVANASPQYKLEYQKLVDWLEAHGESIDEANADVERWRSWFPSDVYRRNMDAEIKARKARERRQEMESAASSSRE